MLIRLETSPDEIDFSYLAALTRVNAHAGTHRTLDVLARWGDMRLNPDTAVSLLAQAAELTLDEFVAAHTESVTRHVVRCESSISATYVRWAPMGSVLAPFEHRRLRFCAECAREDAQTLGRSYWKRTDQLPGRFWCDRHRLPLSETEAEEFSVAPPTACLVSGRSCGEAVVRASVDHPGVARYFQLIQALGTRPGPVTSQVAWRVYYFFAIECGVECLDIADSHEEARRRGKTLVPLAQRVFATFPAAWLECVAKLMGHHTPNDFASMLTGLRIPPPCRAPAQAYLLMLTAMFDSVSDAMSAIDRVERLPTEIPVSPLEVTRKPWRGIKKSKAKADPGPH
ncbi:MAG: TniQ family protein [Mitsuaria chitosanitabida]|uniref:TniQ family protein n=1 Tax=Roseateles chitosanitabidus TaxID=65048 RepID=UPI001B2389F0|nr:TniQ family protein [Roseateles chitosanitabidus]MBO9687093.1 TniQ family protein [Roseateles chitosanitabidus]